MKVSSNITNVKATETVLMYIEDDDDYVPITVPRNDLIIYGCCLLIQRYRVQLWRSTERGQITFNLQNVKTL